MDFYIDSIGGEYDSNSEDEPGKPLIKDNTLVQKLLAEYKNHKLDFPECESEPNAIEKYISLSKGKTVAGWTEEDFGNANRNLKLSTSGDTVTSRRDEVKEVLKKSVITSDFEKLHAVPRYDVSEKTLKRERQKERLKTKGKKWFGLPATEMTEEVKRDLEVIQMRSVLDPKHFYKKNDMKVLPKYFQIGQVVDSPIDFYNNRMTKKERKKTLVEELLADFEFKKYNKRKYKEIIEEKQKTHYKAWRNAKKLKKKK